MVAERLPQIFPEGTSNRGYCIQELAASTVFVMLYIGAVEGAGQYLGPVHVYRMTEEQAKRSDQASRLEYASAVFDRKRMIEGARWYADNTREPIPDETLREGLLAIGAAVSRDDLPTTSGRPRYALKAEFAALFHPSLKGDALDTAVVAFQQAHLSRSALARVSIMRAGAITGDSRVLVTFPNGETRSLAPGPSSVIARAVIEVFAVRFLESPAVLWLSESGNKVVARDEALAQSIGLEVATDRDLPDAILVDLGPSEPLIVFVEIVATDGAMTARRRDALQSLADAAGFSRRQVAFLSAYQDRASAGFKKTITALAWGSFAWCASEPDKILILRDVEATPLRLFELVAR